MARRKQASPIPMVKPDYDSRPTGPTLLDMAAARSAPTTVSETEPVPPILDSVFLTLTLAVLHLTLNVLVHNQYGSAPPTLTPLLKQSALAAPWLGAAVYLLKTEIFASRDVVKQGIHSVVGTVAGVCAITIANEGGYLDVMAKAPGLGVVWVWSVVEMRIAPAVVSLMLCGGWVWWHGYSLM